MTFTFPNPADTTEFTADNGITYSWDVDDLKWQVRTIGLEEKIDVFAPFTAAYRLVHPDNYTGETGTCYAKTDIYERDPENNFGNSYFIEWEFASLDLNGGAAWNDSKSSDYAFDYVFEPVVPDGFNTGVQHGTFVITSRRGFRKYIGEVSYGIELKCSEGCIVYIRNPSVSYVDHKVDQLQNEIVELEEEIDAIAPSVERGEWTFNPLGAAQPGTYALYDGNSAKTEVFADARLIFVSTTDADGNPHGFNNHEVDELIQIFNKNNDEYGLYELNSIDDNSSDPVNPYFSFTVDFVKAFSTTGKAADRARLKFFTAPSGGNADDFIRSDFSVYPELS